MLEHHLTHMLDPGASSASPASAAPAPSRATRSRVRRSAPTRQPAKLYEQKSQKRHTSRACRAHKLIKAKAAIKEAAKRAQITSKLVEPCAVYVGNIGPDVDENALASHFRSCGKILSIRVHCCGGVAMTTKPPPEGHSERARVRQYAVVVFGSKLARKRACKLEGALAGRKVTVSVAISDLPEVREKITKRLDDYRSKMEPPDVHRARKSALKSLGIEPTVLLDLGHERRRRVRRGVELFGHSFPEGIV